MKIDTNKLRAADVFRARGDVRFYLNGIRINKDYIEATDGHRAVRMVSGLKTRLDVIIRFNGKIPKSAIKTKLSFKKNENVAYHYDGFNALISVQIFELIDGKFPDLNKVIPSDFKVDEMPSLQAKYVGDIDKAFRRSNRDFISVKPVHCGKNDKVVYEFKDEIINTLFGNPMVIIMGIREE